MSNSKQFSSGQFSSGVPGWLILIAVMSAVGPIAVDLYLPGFTMIETSLHTKGVERTLAGYLLGMGVGQLFYGPISDRYGRKPPLYFGFALYTLASAGCMLAPNLTFLIVCRVLQALGASSALTIGRAVVRDRCEPEQAARAYSMLMTIFSVAPILAPIAGQFIVTAWGWRAAFVVQVGVGFGVLIAMHFVMTESLSSHHVRSLSVKGVAHTYFRLMRDRLFIGNALVSGFNLAGLFAYISGAPIILMRLFKIPTSSIGWIIGLNGLAFMLSSRLNLLALRKLQPNQLLARVVRWPILAALAMVAISRWTGAPLAAVLVLQFGFFITSARVMPNASAVALAHHAQDAGSASALMGGVQSLVANVGVFVLSIFNDGTLFPMTVLMVITATLSFAMQRWSVGGSR
jgi:MFS transporter, DHA1 family, multidrug resistance protein